MSSQRNLKFSLSNEPHSTRFLISNENAEHSGTKTAKKLSNCLATSQAQFSKVATN